MKTLVVVAIYQFLHNSNLYHIKFSDLTGNIYTINSTDINRIKEFQVGDILFVSVPEFKALEETQSIDSKFKATEEQVLNQFNISPKTINEIVAKNIRMKYPVELDNIISVKLSNELSYLAVKVDKISLDELESIHNFVKKKSKEVSNTKNNYWKNII